MNQWEDFCRRNEIGEEFYFVTPAILDQDLKKLGNEWCYSPFSMYLWGKSGRGKSYFSLCLTRFLLQKNPANPPVWKTSKNIDDNLFECFRTQGTYSSYLRFLKDADILLIDDFGIEKESDSSSRNYYDFINHRWEHHKPTVISTNLSLEEIYKIYGERISSRIKDYESIHFQYPDFRGNGNYKKFHGKN